MSDQKTRRRIDTMLRRESCGRFRSLQHLITMPGYTPTLRRSELADGESDILTAWLDGYYNARIEAMAGRS